MQVNVLFCPTHSTKCRFFSILSISSNSASLLRRIRSLRPEGLLLEDPLFNFIGRRLRVSAFFLSFVALSCRRSLLDPVWFAFSRSVKRGPTACSIWSTLRPLRPWRTIFPPTLPGYPRVFLRDTRCYQNRSPIGTLLGHPHPSLKPDRSDPTGVAPPYSGLWDPQFLLTHYSAYPVPEKGLGGHIHRVLLLAM